MWLLCLQIILYIAGAYALITGKLPLTEHMKLEGRRARITGGILLLPLAVILGYIIVFSAIAFSSGHPQDFRPHADALDVPATFGAIALAVAYVYMTRPKNTE